MPPAIPDELRDRLQGYQFAAIDVGQSGDDLFRLDAHERPPLIVKISGQPSDRLREEAERLLWARTAAVPAPLVIAQAEGAGHRWLVMECLPGVNAAASSEEPCLIVRCVGEALARLHALPVDACPFDETLLVALARAETNVRLGQVEENNFNEENCGRSAREILAELNFSRLELEDLVVAHGDATLENLLVHDGQFAGFVDCGRLGRADRYQDLAIAAQSIRFNLGPEWVGSFLEAYGLTSIDPARMRFYDLLYELF